MRTLITISFLLTFLNSYTQDGTVCEILKEFETPYRPATIQLFKGNVRLDSVTPRFNFEFKNTKLGPGNYKLVFSHRGQETKFIDNIVVGEKQVLKLRIKMKGPCLYDHPYNYIPICPEIHEDKIIPIAYGIGIRLKSKLNDKEDPEVLQGGCITTDCNPKFYCTIHKIAF
jgi:hypothetical protein